MKKIIAVRYIQDKSFEKMGRMGQPLATMKRIIEDANDVDTELAFYIVEDNAKTITPTSKLVGETFKVGDGVYTVTVDGPGKFTLTEGTFEGALPPKKSLRQLRDVANATKRVTKAGRIKIQKHLLDSDIETETKTIYDWYQFKESLK
jgi:hypothetical protein